MIEKSQQQCITSLSSMETTEICVSQSRNQTDQDEINILEYIYVLVKNKWWLIGFTILGIIAGYVLAIIKGPTYKAEAVIAAKENENSNYPNFSGLGAFGGLVAGQLNISGNPGLDKIDLILGSRKFSAELIEKYNLLPLVYKQQYPKIYKNFFDTTINQWKSGFATPNILTLGAGLSNGFLKKEAGKNNTMTLTIESKDSTFCDTLISIYLQYLNIYIQKSVQEGARENVSYLQKQLITTEDPLLREKLQGLIANELEKEMLVSKEAFKIVDPAIRTCEFKNKKIYPLIFGAGLFFITSICILFFYALSKAIKTDEDKVYISKILKQICFFSK